TASQQSRVSWRVACTRVTWPRVIDADQGHASQSHREFVAVNKLPHLKRRIGGDEVAMRRMSDIVRNQTPLILRPTATVKHACQCMRERRVGAVLVANDDGRLLGIFTGRDAVC